MVFGMHKMITLKLQSMKKVLLLTFGLVCFGFMAKAQTATGYCTLPGGEDYVNVDYYNDGYLAVSVNTGKTVTNLHIVVTCTERWIEIEKEQQGVDEYGRPRMVNKKIPKERTHTLCDRTYYEDKLHSNRTNKIEEGVKPMREQYDHTYQYSVSVKNPTCD